MSGIKLSRTQFSLSPHNWQVCRRLHSTINFSLKDSKLETTKINKSNDSCHFLLLKPSNFVQKRWAKYIPRSTIDISKIKDKIPKELLEGPQRNITENSPIPKKTYFGAIDILEDLQKRLAQPAAISELLQIRDNSVLSLAEQWSAAAHKLLYHSVISIGNNGFYPKKESLIEWRSQKYQLLTTTSPSIPGTIKTFTPEEALMQQDIMKDTNRRCWVTVFENSFRKDWQESSMQMITLPRLIKILEDLVKDFQTAEFNTCMYAVKMDLFKLQMNKVRPEIMQKTLNDKIIPLYDRVLAKHQLPGEQGWINFQIAMFDYDPDPTVRSLADKLNYLLLPHDPSQRQMPPK